MQVTLCNSNTVKVILLTGSQAGQAYLLSVDSIPKTVQLMSRIIAENPFAEYINVYDADTSDTLHVCINDAYLGMRDLMSAYRDAISKRNFNAEVMDRLASATTQGSLVESIKALREYFNCNSPDSEIRLDVLRHLAEGLIKIVKKK